MNTTGLVMTVTDELLAELEEITSRQPGATLTVRSGSMMMIYSELRRLRAENADLAKDAGRYRWLRDESLSCGKTAPAIMVVDEAGNPVYRGSPWNSLLCDDDADSAIDTAMATQ